MTNPITLVGVPWGRPAPIPDDAVFPVEDVSSLDVLRACIQSHDPYGLWPHLPIRGTVERLIELGLLEGSPLYQWVTDKGFRTAGYPIPEVDL